MALLRLMTPVYSVTLLLSAVLLFSVQPMFTKMILPLLGGAPQVWNTAMLFFQACLLGGYAYAHLTSKYLSIRTQGILHIVLLAICTVVLPFAIPEGWDPPADKDPTLWQLSLMALTVGGPFFIISGSAPMLQHWFGSSDHKDAQSPYFLYGASNLGSMTALLTYPVLTEPMLDLTGQTHLWMYGYITLILLTAASLFLLKPAAAGLKNANISKVDDAPISNALRLRWVILAAIPSSLMLGVTTYITTDIASVPLLWVLPLALYVSTFIFVFANKPWIKVDTIFAIFGTGLVSMAAAILFFKLWHNAILLIACHMVLFFLVALYCHFHLAKVRPGASKLTEFYFFMSLGGVIGGFFNAIIAPVFFVTAIEYPLVLGLAMLVRYANDPERTFKKFLIILGKKAFSLNTILIFIVLGAAYAGYLLKNSTIDIIAAVIVCISLLIDIKKRWQFGSLALLLIMTSPLAMPILSETSENVILRDRNFFGTIRILDNPDFRTLLHGTTNHGSQPLAPDEKLLKITYFSEISPVADVFKILDKMHGENADPKNVGILGLGIGAMACYTHPGRHFDFYEIDNEINLLAKDPKYFTYLSDCGSSYDVIMGDGRLNLKKQESQKYQALFMDAFSSDNIPVHLVTKEAIDLYFEKIKPDGLIAVHISNNYLDMEPVLKMIADNLGIYAVAHVKEGGKLQNTNIEGFPSHYFVMTKNQQIINDLKELGWSEPIHRDGVALWTDKYTNIFTILGNRSFEQRAKNIKKIAESKQEEPPENVSK